MRKIALFLLNLGIDPRRLIALKYMPKYRKDRQLWLNQGGKITSNRMILSDFEKPAGVIKGHYFHQDLLVARMVFENKPKRHVDIASRIDGFVAHVASFREIETVDVRPLPTSDHENIKFVEADFMKPNMLGYTDSLSCLHAIEHFGLGRYNDPIDIDGHNKGINNLVEMVSDGGRLYISFPIGERDAVYFNGHRIFEVRTIFNHPKIQKFMELERFDYVDDNGDLHTNSSIHDVDPKIKFGCGIYTFIKIVSQSKI